jgi:hypothetical protein
MRDITTEELINTLVLKVKRDETTRIIASIHPAGFTASAYKKAQRESRSARTALDRHLKECIRLVRKSRRIMSGVIEAKDKEHLYRPKRRGLKKVKS